MRSLALGASLVLALFFASVLPGCAAADDAAAPASAAARRAWQAARTVPTFAAWKLASTIDDRLAGKTHEDVGAAPYLCTQCHPR